MNIQEYLEVLFHWYLLLQIGSNDLDLRQTGLLTLRVIVGKKATVHVTPLGVCSIISNDDSIWVNDWCNPNLILISHLLRHHMPR